MWTIGRETQVTAFMPYEVIAFPVGILLHSSFPLPELKESLCAHAAIAFNKPPRFFDDNKVCFRLSRDYQEKENFDLYFIFWDGNVTICQDVQIVNKSQVLEK